MVNKSDKEQISPKQQKLYADWSSVAAIHWNDVQENLNVLKLNYGAWNCV